MYRLFTHCLPTIICVMLMSIVLFFSLHFHCFFLFFFSVHVLFIPTLLIRTHTVLYACAHGVKSEISLDNADKKPLTACQH